MIRLKPRVSKLNQRHPLAQGLVGAWPFYEGGGAVVNDLSGYRNRGALQNAPPWTVGPFGSAISFNGSSQSVDTGNLSPINAGATDLTLCAWVNRTTSGSNTDQIIANDKNTGTRQFNFCIGGTGQGAAAGKLAFEQPGVGTQIGTAVLNNNQWYFVAIVFHNGSTVVTFFINGAQDAQSTTFNGLVSSTNNITIGARQYAGFEDWFHGYIDNPLIYRRALSHSEMRQLYHDPFAIYRRYDYRVGSVAAASFTYFPLVQPDSEALILRRPVMVGY